MAGIHGHRANQPARFFLRRFRRLAPAWTVVALAVFTAGYAILLPHDLREWASRTPVEF